MFIISPAYTAPLSRDGGGVVMPALSASQAA
jgi:hypothetical protein